MKEGKLKRNAARFFAKTDFGIMRGVANPGRNPGRGPLWGGLLAGSFGRKAAWKRVPRGDPGQDCPPHSKCRIQAAKKTRAVPAFSNCGNAHGAVSGRRKSRIEREKRLHCDPPPERLLIGMMGQGFGLRLGTRNSPGQVFPLSIRRAVDSAASGKAPRKADESHSV